MKRFVKLYSLCSLGRCSKHESVSRYWCWLMGLQLMREKVVHLACSRSCHGFMCLWESTELQAAAWKMCTAATSAPSETPRARHSKDLEENPNTANTWNADWGRSVKVHKLRSNWVSRQLRAMRLDNLSEERPRGALQRKNTIATTVQFLVNLLLGLQPSLETMICKCLQNINCVRNSYFLYEFCSSESLDWVLSLQEFDLAAVYFYFTANWTLG